MFCPKPDDDEAYLDEHDDKQGDKNEALHPYTIFQIIYHLFFKIIS